MEGRRIPNTCTTLGESLRPKDLAKKSLGPHFRKDFLDPGREDFMAPLKLKKINIPLKNYDLIAAYVSSVTLT